MLWGKIKPIREIGNARVGKCNEKPSGQESLSEKVMGYLGPQCPKQMGEPGQQWPCQGGQCAWSGAGEGRLVSSEAREVAGNRWTMCRACGLLYYCNQISVFLGL